LLFLLLFICTGLSAQQNVDPAKGFTLENEFARYVFEPVGMGLSSMVDLETGYDHIAPVEGDHLLCTVVFGKGVMRPAIDNNYKPCSYGGIYKKANGDQILILEWNDLRFWEEDSVCSVKVTIELPSDDGVAKWNIFVSNRSDYWGLWEAACPAVNGFPSTGKYDLATPVTGTCGHKEKVTIRILSDAVLVIK